MLFHACAMRSMFGPSLLMIAAVTSMPSSSAMTCDGIIEVAANSCPKSTSARSAANDTLARFCPGAQSTVAISR